MSLDVWVSAETVRLWCYCGNILNHWGRTGSLVYNGFCTFSVICMCLWIETAGLHYILDIVIRLVTYRLFLSVWGTQLCSPIATYKRYIQIAFSCSQVTLLSLPWPTVSAPSWILQLCLLSFFSCSSVFIFHLLSTSVSYRLGNSGFNLKLKKSFTLRGAVVSS